MDYCKFFCGTFINKFSSKELNETKTAEKHSPDRGTVSLKFCTMKSIMKLEVIFGQVWKDIKNFIGSKGGPLLPRGKICDFCRYQHLFDR